MLVADVFELAGTLRRSGDALAARVDQSQARWQVLSVLSEGEWTVPQVARRLGISRQAVQRIVDVLAEQGLVRIVDNPAHRRSALVALTRAGRSTLGHITDSSHAWRARIAARFSTGELESARATLRKLLEHARDAPPDDD
ncbi:MarR family winged helix-turn-helix transcriptional regulator [Candidatus Binatia bacterium]|nr:MarR family winged helix-turn-helix transcriptional regulator [Candidatus Binatia bacterium]